LKIGANDYIAKPFNPDVLGEKIRVVLNKAQQVKGDNASKKENPAR